MFSNGNSFSDGNGDARDVMEAPVFRWLSADTRYPSR